MASRRSIDEERRELRVRVQDLEARVRWLERRLGKVEKAAKVKPAAPSKTPPRPRCPGCFCEVPKGQRDHTCLYCGFDFDVVKPFRPRRER
jgi:hypothetical protein